MNIIFGANSSMPATAKLTNGYTLFDWVMRKNCFPAFWGRNLGGENQITAEEIEFLREKDCKIALVLKDLTEAEVSEGGGFNHGIMAVRAAKELLVPQNSGIALFAEFQPEWSVNHNWMLGFARALNINGYVPGFIGNTDSSKNFNFGRECSHFAESSRYVNYFGAVFCATEPKKEEMPEVWAPFSPSELEPEEIQLWATGETKFKDITVDNVYARDDKVLESMW